MNPFACGRDFIIRRSFRRTLEQLRRASEEELLAGAPDRVVKVFRNAVRSVPGYSELLDQRGASRSQVETLEEFQRLVPILNKTTWFGRSFRSISASARRGDVAAFFSSSGQTGLFSMGTETRAEQKRAALFLEFAFQQAFAALDRKTFLINCLSMGVRAHTRTIPVAETSVREDVVLNLLKKLSAEFEQFLLLGEHLFLKLVVEEGLAQPEPIDWKALRVHVITGAEYVSESFRTYLASRMGMELDDPKGGSININYGLSEIAASIAHENWHTIQIRRLAHQNAAFRDALCGESCSFCPTVMQYHPSQVFLETDESNTDRPELVVTVLDTQRVIPIIRYNTGDRARTVSYSHIASVLRAFGRPDLIPPIRTPGLLLWGKAQGFKAGSAMVYPEQVKEALYSDLGIARAISGSFRIGSSEGKPKVTVQLRQDQQRDARVQSVLRAECERVTGVSVEMEVVPYLEFPFGIRNDFERKNQYLERQN